jgi:two-component system chemotaxis response regulator CheB
VEEIMASRPLPVLVISSRAGYGRDETAAALAAGALDALAKEDLNLREPAGAEALAFRQRVKMLSRARVIRHPRARLRGESAAIGVRRSASVIGICASTGGPHVLVRLLSALPAGFPIPVLAVQHIASGFTEGLAHWLDQSAAIGVGIAREGARAGPGVWIAPEGAHLTLTNSGHLGIDRYTVSGRHRPSGDVLFNSIAASAGRSGVAIVLTGMGSDGAAGAAAVQRNGGIAIAQDEATSAVFGMPKAAIGEGVGLVMPPNEIADYLLRLHHRPLGAPP